MSDICHTADNANGGRESFSWVTTMQVGCHGWSVGWRAGRQALELPVSWRGVENKFTEDRPGRQNWENEHERTVTARDVGGDVRRSGSSHGVKNFCARGDGNADDTGAFRDAIVRTSGGVLSIGERRVDRALDRPGHELARSQASSTDVLPLTLPAGPDHRIVHLEKKAL